MSEQPFAAGHVFFRSGDAAAGSYLLHEGEIELLAGADGSSTCVRRLSPGEVFGELALIEERPRACTARAVTSGRVTWMTREEFEHGLMHDPAQTLPYLGALFERLRTLAAASGGAQLEPAVPAESEATSALQSPVEFPVGAGTTSDWAVVIHPLTHQAAATLPDEGLLVSQFPLRIGRASDSREPEALDLNDLWLLDRKPYHVSRNHCEIVVDQHGPIVRDRGSHLGCIVNETPIGGRTASCAARLDPGENVLVVGSRMSKYQFRIIVGWSAGA
jgi:hypothetical protein